MAGSGPGPGGWSGAGSRTARPRTSPPSTWGSSAGPGRLRGNRVTLYCSICSVCTFRFIQTILVERTTIEAALDPAVAHAGGLVQDSHLHRVARPGVGYCSEFLYSFNPLKIISARPLLGTVVGEHGAGAAGGDDGHAGHARVEGVVVRGLAGEAAVHHHGAHPVLHLANQR